MVTSTSSPACSPAAPAQPLYRELPWALGGVANKHHGELAGSYSGPAGTVSRDRRLEKMPDKMVEYVLNILPDKMSDRVSEKMPEIMPG